MTTPQRPHVLFSGPAHERLAVLLVELHVPWTQVQGWAWRGRRLCLRLPDGWVGWVMPSVWRQQWDAASEHWGAMPDDSQGLSGSVRLNPYRTKEPG